MIFHQLLTQGYDSNFSYFVGDENTKEIAIIDPINSSMLLPMIEEQGLTVTHLIATHGHFDHCGEMENFWNQLNPKPLLLFHESIEAKVKIKEADYHLITKQETFKIGGVEIQAIPTPGHEPGSVCFLAEEKLMTGDTLFINGCGRTDLAGGNVDQLYHSLYHTLRALPNETVIYPGHDYGSVPFDTLANQNTHNPYLKCESKEAFVALRGGH